MRRKIITYPNKRLFLRSQEITSFDEGLHTLLDDMYETMIEHNGVGLAAIQIDEPLRVLLVNIPDENGEQHKEDLLELINPKLSTIGEELITFTEGCLSIPDFFEEVTRHKNIRLEYQDRFGKPCALEASEFLAVAIQHEVDHLNGHLFIEKLPYSKHVKFEKEFKKKQKDEKAKKRKPQ